MRTTTTTLTTLIATGANGSQEQADERLVEIEQRITDRVNGVKPAEGEWPGRG